MDCWFTLLVLLFVLGILKKALKMTSQLVVLRSFFHPQTLNLKRIPVNQLIKNSGLTIDILSLEGNMSFPSDNSF